MVDRNTITQYVESILGSDLVARAQATDRSANGVQVHGTEKVHKIALGVSANLDFLSEAVAAGANYTITHHGLNLSEKYIYGARLDPAAQGRLKLAFANGLTVAAYHYSLDVQPVFGNNATIIRKLGAKTTGETYFDTWGYIGEFSKPITLTELSSRCATVFSHDVYLVKSGNDLVRRIGVCSGGAKPQRETLFEAIDKHVDAHIAGEIVEGIDHLVKECGFSYLSCGHYATEVFGVQELGKRIKSHFGDKLEVEFIDIPNPL